MIEILKEVEEGLREARGGEAKICPQFGLECLELTETQVAQKCKSAAKSIHLS